MTDIGEVKKLLNVLERQLEEQGLLNDKGFLATPLLPAELCEKLDGLIENSGELDGLLLIAHAARSGDALSTPVAQAARLMMEEICYALLAPAGSSKVKRVH